MCVVWCGWSPNRFHIKSLEQRLLTRLGHWQSRKRGVRAGGKQKNNSRAANHSTWHQRSAAGRCSCAISTIKSETRAARRTHATETRAQCGIVIISDRGVVWCGVVWCAARVCGAVQCRIRESANRSQRRATRHIQAQRSRGNTRGSQSLNNACTPAPHVPAAGSAAAAMARGKGLQFSFGRRAYLFQMSDTLQRRSHHTPRACLRFDKYVCAGRDVPCCLLEISASTGGNSNPNSLHHSITHTLVHDMQTHPHHMAGTERAPPQGRRDRQGGLCVNVQRKSRIRHGTAACDTW